MLKSHEKFHSLNGKRLILIVDDEQTNREILGFMLTNDYELIYASNGQEALTQIRQNKDTLSLILLDLMMPEMSGWEVLQVIRADKELSAIPVMVLTSEKEAEVESLKLGASDFLTKPYSQPEVIKARIVRTIELSEDREIIQSTERDPLTGLYNREFFFSYAEQYDAHHKDSIMDAIVVDINHFHMINERYGKDYGDMVLHTISEKLRIAMQDCQGIVCRREADTFLVYCPHGEDYKKMLAFAAEGLGQAANEATVTEGRFRLRMGVYPKCDKSINIERRFDRAQMAADRIRSDLSTSIAFYDKVLHDAQLHSEQLLEDFQRGIDNKEFQVYFQPKFDIRTKIPALDGAEALVRWIHPEFGFISPGEFIPLFEENGLIRQLDRYVWEEAGKCIRKWKDEYGLTIPVSVNVSRVDMYDPELISILTGIVEKNGLNTCDLLLEITESAYTEDSDQLIEVTSKLRKAGFIIEMDDFGTGYSSLNMITSLPVDVLKIDMIFIRNAFSEQKNVRMLEFIMEIAEYISVPVIAEGVETAVQVEELKKLGCEFVQGYYFSKPLPEAGFVRFIEEKKNSLIASERDASEDLMIEQRALTAFPPGFYQSLFRALDNNSVLRKMDFRGKYVPVSCSREFAKMMECTPEEFIETEHAAPHCTIYEEDRESVEYFLEHGKTREGLTHSVIRKRTLKGNIIWVDVHYAFFENKGTKYAYCNYYNVTEMKLNGNTADR